LSTTWRAWRTVIHQAHNTEERAGRDSFKKVIRKSSRWVDEGGVEDGAYKKTKEEEHGDCLGGWVKRGKEKKGGVGEILKMGGKKEGKSVSRRARSTEKGSKVTSS